MTDPYCDGGAVLTFQPLPPYDFAHTMNGARFYAVLGRRHEGAWRRALRVGNAVVLVEIRQYGSDDAPVLEARVLSASGAFERVTLQAKLERLLNLHIDLRPFYEHAQRDPVLWNTVQHVYGLRTITSESVLEALVLSIIEQQITLRMAHAAERWLFAAYGDSIAYAGETFYVFPTPERLAALTIDDLRPLKITGMRIQRILDAAQAVASGTLDLEGLRGLEPDERYALLRGLKGVGHWTACWTLLKGLGDFANFGSGDVGLRAAVNSYYFDQPGNAPRGVVDSLLAEYAPYDGIAAFYTLMRWAFERYPYI